ncbi:hypothetical protein N1030_13350 [Desulfovibrio mangrovi]|uniref:hypothetical protein n=1 Tax=Desulfovibrio mangrovi TaxID=2976983 RepID=UPI002247F501|nr:hypothetical protein [Desulfovibrio mangrovi]UZP66589.1 hypothetical protein N1030_13350 [Desulfovibrio mangrovi]
MTKGSTQKAIRRFCMACQGASSKQVAACEDTECALHPHRSGEEVADAPCPSHRAIRRFCMACCANLRAEVRGCAAREDCALWSFRFGCTPETWRRVKNRRSSPRPLLLPGFSKK